MRPIDLTALVSDIVADAQWEARERHCRVELMSRVDCTIDANPDLLRSATENVIRNAIRYTAPGTAVEVHLECRRGDGGDAAIIRVPDRGPGVPAAELSNIFRPFYRVADARDRESGGVGLGWRLPSAWPTRTRGSIRAANRAGGGLEVVLSLNGGRCQPGKEQTLAGGLTRLRLRPSRLRLARDPSHRLYFRSSRSC